MKYRREIDGLRAVAVIPVIFFHAGFAGFGGGFVGVDIFFVISGYLITSIILDEQQGGRFTLARFYERRARRILPALFMVMLACIPFAFAMMIPSVMKSFAVSVAAVATFTSNLLFWKENGYFDTAGELKPLLHTWSLAVEEQYYLLFPLFIIVMTRFAKRWTVPILAVAAVASLALAQWGSLNRPVGTYLLLPTRGWEILTGALVAFYLFHRTRGITKISMLDEALGCIGLLLIAYSVCTFDKTTPFPGLWAVFPVAGTALVILFAEPHTLSYRLLGSKILVGLGLISYSAYLWHNPLFVFARLQSLESPSYRLLFGLSCAAFILAYISWRFLEMPLRRSMSLRPLMVGAVTLSVFFVALGLYGRISDGFENVYLARLTPVQREIYQRSQVQESISDNGDCRFGLSTFSESEEGRFRDCAERYGPGFIILGDSHSTNVFIALATNTAAPFIVTLGHGICTLQESVLRLKAASECKWDQVATFLKNHQSEVRRVVYTQAGYQLLRGKGDGPGTRELFTQPYVPLLEVNPALIGPTLAFLDDLASEVHLVWFGPRIEPHKNFAKILELSYRCDLEKVGLDENVRETFVRMDGYLKQVSAGHHFRYISQVDAIKFDERHDIYDCSAAFWADGDHWSRAGNEYFGKRFASSLLAE